MRPSRRDAAHLFEEGGLADARLAAEHDQAARRRGVRAEVGERPLDDRDLLVPLPQGGRGGSVRPTLRHPALSRNRPIDVQMLRVAAAGGLWVGVCARLRHKWEGALPERDRPPLIPLSRTPHTVAPMTQVTPPGWYPDPGQKPEGPRTERWWDGSVWTEQTRAAETGAAPGPPAYAPAAPGAHPQAYGYPQTSQPPGQFGHPGYPGYPAYPEPKPRRGLKIAIAAGRRRGGARRHRRRGVRADLR